MKPNFFIIGAPKSGTSSLFEYLKMHPAFFMCPIKEPGVFSTDLYPRTRMDIKRYLALFAGADPTVHRAVGEGSTSYLFSDEAISGILTFNPEAKFIVMLRNPIELVRSWHSQKIFEGRENIFEFEMAWIAEAERRIGKKVPYSCWDSRELLYSEWGKLGEQMERLLKKVSKERLKIIFFEDFKKDPSEIYRSVLSFLGVEDDGQKYFPVINEAKIPKWPKLQRAISVVIRETISVRCRLRLPYSVFGVTSAIMLSNSKPKSGVAGGPSPISESFKRVLKEYYLEDVYNLSRLTDRDLSHWLV